jgi:hypothetical protein
MSASTQPYLGVRPQIIRNAPMLIVSFKGDPKTVREHLPSGLEPHPDGRLLLNLWAHTDPDQNSGFGGYGPMTVGYIAIEVAGHDGSSARGDQRWPARYFAFHWLGSELARSYAREASGLETDFALTTWEKDSDKVVATLIIRGEPAATIRATVGDRILRTGSGHSNYFAVRNSEDGGRDLIKLSIPSVGDVYDAKADAVRFSFPRGAPALTLVANGPVEPLSVSYRSLSFVPYLPYQHIARLPA